MMRVGLYYITMIMVAVTLVGAPRDMLAMPCCEKMQQSGAMPCEGDKNQNTDQKCCIDAACAKLSSYSITQHHSSPALVILKADAIAHYQNVFVGHIAETLERPPKILA